MTDPNMSDFYRRVAKIEKARKKGYGFEAAGTLGRSYYAQPAPRRKSVLGPLVFLLVCGFLLKGVMFSQVGADLYNQRVTNLMQGEGLDRVGGWLMQADPVTLYVAEKVNGLLLSLK
ncbi:hypothetical protein GC209_10205 [bacterium]|nr:hypothetical protein [bacterium]